MFSFDSAQNQDPNQKLICVAIAGTGGKEEYRDVAVLPGTQARDIIEQLGLEGYQLEKPNEGAFARYDDVYQSVQHGQKVYARPSNVEAGGK